MREEKPSLQQEQSALPWTRHDWAILATLALVAGFALWPYWARVPTVASDTTMAIYRAFELDRSIAQRVFYPVLATDFNFTYGAPLLEYRPPLVHYMLLVSYWVFQNWINAARAVGTLELLVAGLGMYLCARWHFADRRAALVSGATFLLAPYLLLDLNERGAIGEAAALAVLPWLFLAIHRILRDHGREWIWLGALLTAVLMLAHNIVSFFSLPVLLLYFCLLAWHEQTWRRLPAAFTALALGLALSAFYWTPAFLERSDAKILTNLVTAPLVSHLAPLNQLVQGQVAFDYWGPLRFRLSLWQALLALLAIPALVVSRKRYRGSIALLLGITAGVMMLQLEASGPVWSSIPLASFLQFPWRLLGVATFCIALLAGFLVTWPRLSGTWGWIVTGCLLLISLYAGTLTLGAQYQPPSDRLAEDAVSLDELYNLGHSFFTIFSDFLPVSVAEDTTRLVNPRPASDPAMPPMAYVPVITVSREEPFRLELQVHAEQPFTLRIHRFFFPGWEVYVAGKRVPTGPSGMLGLVTADLPRGDYLAVVRFGRTPVRVVAEAITLAGLLTWLAAGIWMRRTRPAVGIIGVLAILALTLLLVRHGTGEPPHTPIAYLADFGGEIRLLGYDLPRKTWLPGDHVPVRFYWLARATPSADYKVFMHLIEPDDSRKVAQADATPVRGTSPTTRWESGEVVVDDHELYLDGSVPPGKYLLVVGLYRPESAQNLLVTGASKVLPGDRLPLTEIQVGSR